MITVIEFERTECLTEERAKQQMELQKNQDEDKAWGIPDTLKMWVEGTAFCRIYTASYHISMIERMYQTERHITDLTLHPGVAERREIQRKRGWRKLNDESDFDAPLY